MGMRLLNQFETAAIAPERPMTIEENTPQADIDYDEESKRVSAPIPVAP